MLEKIVIISLISAFSLLLFLKLFKQFIQINTKKVIIYKLIECNFCLSFWTSLIFCIIFSIYYKDFNYLYYVILVTPVVRFLI
jgi:hypothetical protein